MSPEQFRKNREELTPASDVFSAGTILYQMLTGLHPFEGADLPSVMNKVIGHIPPPVHELNPNIPRRLSQICEKMLEKETQNRYQDCHELKNVLELFMDSGQAFVRRTFKPDEIIFKEGAPGEYAFMIESGRVEITKRHDGVDRVLAVLEKNQIVGELAIFSRLPRTATARALDPTCIRVMNREDVEKELEKLSPWVEGMITGLAHRFIGLNQKLLDEVTLH
jgi:serine/threonine protein kinase